MTITSNQAGSITKVGNNLNGNGGYSQDVDAWNTPAVTKLVLSGTFSSDDLSNLCDKLGIGKNSNGANCLTELDLTDAIIPADAKIERWKSSLQTLKVPTNANYNVIPAGFCNNCPALTSIVLGENITEIGATAFQQTGITSIDLPRNLQVINGQAFANTKLTSITIPGSVTTIKTNAFNDCFFITKVIFDEKRDAEGNPIMGEDGKSAVNMTIEKEAFTQDTGILDVYVENTGNIVCKNQAFDLGTTYGHGDATTVTATLHFPASEASKYTNAFGTPLTMDIAMNPARYHDWLMTHFDEAQAATNGWYEFRSNGTTSDAPATPKFLKTFCDMEYDRMVPEGTKAYVVYGIAKDGDNFKVSLQSIPVIPKGTGVILYGAANSRNKDGGKVLSLPICYIQDSYPYDRAHWDRLVVDELKNLLLPTGTSGVHLDPYEDVMENGKKVRYRNFIMSRIKNTNIAKNEIGLENISNNYVGFFRVISSEASGGKAYLHLKNDEYDDGQGMEAIIVGDLEQYGTSSYKMYQMEVDRRKDAYGLVGPDETGLWKTGTGADPDMEWTAESNWGDRSQSGVKAKLMFFDEPEFIPYEDGSATVIIPASMIGGAEKDVYFTPQGIRVNNPTSGLYIKNGKKVVIK